MPHADIPLAIRAPLANRDTVFRSSHSLRCRDPRCVAENQAEPRRSWQRWWTAHRGGPLPQQPPAGATVADSVGRPEANSRSGSSLHPDSLLGPNPWVTNPGAAQVELVNLARRWTGQYSDGALSESPPMAGPGSQAIFLSGHQPELFHPGVWYKNFVLAEAARQTQALGINLLIDQDLIKSNWLVIPSEGSPAGRRRVAFDYGGVGLPFEERQVEQPDVLRSFPRRVADHLAAWVQPELLSQLWPDVELWSRELRGLGYGFAAARHRCEQRNGCRNLEVPLNWICRTVSFAEFVVSVLRVAPRFVAAYNNGLADYRHWYGIAGTQRPMPDLLVHDAWYELPFWLWTVGHPWRKRLMVRRTPEGWQLSVANGGQVDLAAWQLDLAESTAVEQLHDFSDLQIRLRPRALLTTLYGRGVLSQGFLHGIGGALYDQMTDRLAEAAFGWRLPDYAIATATLHLGGPVVGPTVEQRAGWQRYLRDLRFAPERIPWFAEQHPEWVAEKRRLLRTQPPPRQRAAWQRQVDHLLAQAQHWTRDEQHSTERKLAQWAEQRREHALRTNREWSLVLFPERLPTTLQEMAAAEFGLC